jgi:two-component system, cell cycle response regulator
MDSQTTILIVDDELAGREALEGVLFLEGYHLVFAENGKEACEKAAEAMPDVILLDVMMPNMDGYEVCRTMRADPVLKEIPILLITALDDRASRLRGIEAGADDFISKPFDRMELRARVRTITRLNRYRRLMLERTRFTWVVEQATDGYMLLTAADEVTFANLAACTYLNLPSGGKIDGAFKDWVGKQFSLEPEEIWKQWPHIESTRGPIYLIRPGLQSLPPVWLQVEVLSLPAGDENTILIKINDISERLALQQEIWTFQSMLTHKLLTPFSQMSMSAELIARQAQRFTDQDMKELAESVLLGTRRIIQEVKDVLGYLNASSIAQTGSKFDLADLENLVRQISKTMSITRLVFGGTRFPPGTWIKLSDRAIEIILREILENAKKFHPQLIPTIEVSLVAYNDHSYLLTVRDDGIHLPPEQLKRAWIPYYQGEKEFTGEVAGMGLGLSTVSTLVWEVGGKYRMYNREDRPGIVVELILPADSV